MARVIGITQSIQKKSNSIDERTVLKYEMEKLFQLVMYGNLGISHVNYDKKDSVASQNMFEDASKGTDVHFKNLRILQ